MDFGSTHSFIFNISLGKTGNKCVKVNNSLNVSTLSSEVINISQMVKDIKVKIEGKVLSNKNKIH